MLNCSGKTRVDTVAVMVQYGMGLSGSVPLVLPFACFPQLSPAVVLQGPWSISSWYLHTPYRYGGLARGA